MTVTLNFRTFASSVAAVALTTGASFAAESWTMPSGSTDNFNYSQGQTENGLFTDSSPDVFGDTLLFFPNNFIADDNDTSVSDQLSFVTNAKPGVKLQKVSATLTGDYSSDDIITAIAFPGFGSTMATAQLTLINADNTADTRTQNVTFTPSSPFFGDGQFSGVASLDVPSSWVNILVQLDATLSTFNLVPSINGNALVANGNGSVIQLKGTNIELQAAAVPLPGALLAAPGAMAVAWFARRKLNKR
ncbi:MAG TPA: hypothetical protein VF624_06975 [Tepidisphaeraceae bacterium]|jgi:hypothetical protein